MYFIIQTRLPCLPARNDRYDVLRSLCFSTVNVTRRDIRARSKFFSSKSNSPLIRAKSTNSTIKMSGEPQLKKTRVVSVLDQLKQVTTIVADTGDFEGKQFFGFFFPFVLAHCRRAGMAVRLRL